MKQFTTIVIQNHLSINYYLIENIFLAAFYIEILLISPTFQLVTVMPVVQPRKFVPRISENVCVRKDMVGKDATCAWTDGLDTRTVSLVSALLREFPPGMGFVIRQLENVLARLLSNSYLVMNVVNVISQIVEV